MDFLTILNLFLAAFLIFFIIDIFSFLLRKIPPLATSSQTTQAILKILEKRKKGKFFDLGCGWGKILIAVKRKYPEMEVRGYENWPSQFFLLRLLTWFSGIKVKVFYQDLFSANLKEADFVFCYLSKSLMERLEKKLEAELKEGSLVISSTFPLPNWRPNQIIVTNQRDPDFEKLFIYEKGNPQGRKINRD